MARRSGGGGGAAAVAGWNPRTAGLVLCAFFMLGVMTGFSATGRALTRRAITQANALTARAIDSFAPARAVADRYTEALRYFAARLGLIRAVAPEAPSGARRGGAVAIVERRDGFYALLADGELRGPVAPGQSSDLPVLSGAALETSHGSDMVADAAVVVRAEAELSKIISEMRIAVPRSSANGDRYRSFQFRAGAAPRGRGTEALRGARAGGGRARHDDARSGGGAAARRRYQCACEEGRASPDRGFGCRRVAARAGESVRR